MQQATKVQAATTAKVPPPKPLTNNNNIRTPQCKHCLGKTTKRRNNKDQLESRTLTRKAMMVLSIQDMSRCHPPLQFYGVKKAAPTWKIFDHDQHTNYEQYWSTQASRTPTVTNIPDTGLFSLLLHRFINRFATHRHRQMFIEVPSIFTDPCENWVHCVVPDVHSSKADFNVMKYCSVDWTALNDAVSTFRLLRPLFGDCQAMNTSSTKNLIAGSWSVFHKHRLVLVPVRPLNHCQAR